jgi:hypothetical protein
MNAGIELVKRGEQYNKVVDSKEDEVKRPFKSKMRNASQSPENVVQEVSRNHSKISSTLQTLTDNMMFKSNRFSPDELVLKSERFEFQKEFLTKKMEIEAKRAKIESYRADVENKRAEQEHLHAKLKVIDERIELNKREMKEYKESEDTELYEYARKSLIENMKSKSHLEMQLFKE